MVNERWFGKVVKPKGCGLIQFFIPEFAWRDWGEPQSGSLWITGLRVNIWPWAFPNKRKGVNHWTMRFSVKLWTFVNMTTKFRVSEKAGSLSTSWSRKKPYRGVCLRVDLPYRLCSFRPEVTAWQAAASHTVGGLQQLLQLGFRTRGAVSWERFLRNTQSRQVCRGCWAGGYSCYRKGWEVVGILATLTLT